MLAVNHIQVSYWCQLLKRVALWEAIDNACCMKAQSTQEKPLKMREENKNEGEETICCSFFPHTLSKSM